MRLKKLILKDFRNYENREFTFDENVTAFVGPNAQGKTNILEAIRLVSVGESLKAGKVEEMVRFGQESGSVEVKVDDGVDEEKLTVVLTRGELAGKRVSKRRYLVEDVGKRKADFVGSLSTVVFRPEDLDLMSGSPSGRRRWMDEILSQTSAEYQSSLAAYEKALRRRNRILVAIREEASSRYQLTFWDGLVIKHGQKLTEYRTELIDYVNGIFSRSDLFGELRIEYDSSVISEKRLEQYAAEEVLAGHTLVGPHKDDFSVISQTQESTGRNLATYGSRGEQRMAVLGLKMGELLYMEEKLGEKPLLLLDDVFSELDDEHSSEVHRVMKGRQVVVTTTDEEDLVGIEGVKLVKLG